MNRKRKPTIALLLTPVLALAVGGCEATSRPGSSSGRKLSWSGDRLPDNPVPASEPASTISSTSTYRSAGRTSTHSSMTAAVPGAGNTTIIVEEPVILGNPYGYGHGYGGRHLHPQSYVPGYCPPGTTHGHVHRPQHGGTIYHTPGVTRTVITR